MDHRTYYIWKLLVFTTITSTVLPLKKVFECLNAPLSLTLEAGDGVWPANIPCKKRPSALSYSFRLGGPV